MSRTAHEIAELVAGRPIAGGPALSVRRTRAIMLDGTAVECSRGVELRPILRMEGREEEQINVRTGRWIRYVETRDGHTRVLGRGERAT